MSVPPETKYAKRGDSHVAYQVIGEGPIDLVLVNAWGSSIEALWEEPSVSRYLHRLARFSRLICFDKRGTGVSDPVPLASLPTLEQWMDDIITVTEAVDSDRAALLGVSDGGFMAMLYAATYPERTSALVLVNAYARFLRDKNYQFGLPRASITEFLRLVEEDWGTGADASRVAWPGAAKDPQFRAWVGRNERLALSPGGALTIYKVMFETDVRSVLPSIHVPTLVCQSRENAYTPAGHGQYLAEHIPGARYLELPGGDVLPTTFEQQGASLDVIQEFLTGIKGTVEADRVLATVLFTDIVGSTKLAAELGDSRWKQLLDEHDEIVRQEIQKFRGREVKTSGDGFLMTFDGPARAITCAQAICEETRRIGVDLRSGLHTGEIELRVADISGIAVHLAQRVMAEAGAGEVLVSSAVPPLVAGSGIRFDDRGARTLKGVPGDWRLFAAQTQ